MSPAASPIAAFPDPRHNQRVQIFSGLGSELRTRPVNNDVFRWIICPIPEDPRHGFIRPDAFLRDVKRIDGTPVFPALGNNFRCLQQTGDWCT